MAAAHENTARQAGQDGKLSVVYIIETEAGEEGVERRGEELDLARRIGVAAPSAGQMISYG